MKALTGAAHETLLSVGDMMFRVVSDDCRLASTPAGLESFCVDHGGADVDIRARWTDIPVECGGNVLFDSGGAWQLLRSDNDFLFTFRSSMGGPVPYKTARFNPTFTAGEVQLYRRHFDQHSSDTVVYALEYPLDELLMIHLLSQGRGVEIHGCGLLDAAGRGYVFAGQSGAGKSTMARLWVNQPGVTLLSDERVVVRTDRERITIHGTPWHGDAMLVSPRSGELAGVFLLNQSASHAVVPIGGSRAAARLLACSFMPFHSAAAVDRTVRAMEQVIKGVPCHDLWFAPDRSVIDALTRHMG